MNTGEENYGKLTLEELWELYYDSEENKDDILRTINEKLIEMLSAENVFSLSELIDIYKKYSVLFSHECMELYRNSEAKACKKSAHYLKYRDMSIEELELLLYNSENYDNEDIYIIWIIIEDKINKILKKCADVPLEIFAETVEKYHGLFSPYNWEVYDSIAVKQLKGRIPYEIRCPQCLSMNPVQNEVCGHCGSKMDRRFLIPDYHIHPDKYTPYYESFPHWFCYLLCILLSWFGYDLCVHSWDNAVDLPARIFVIKCRILCIISMAVYVGAWLFLEHIAKHGF